MFIRKLTIMASALFWSGWWLLGGLVLLWMLLRWWPGDRLVWVRLLNYASPWLLAALLVGVIIAGIGRRPILMALLALPMLIIAITYAPLFLPRQSPALAAKNSLTVMSHNIWRRNGDLTAAVDLVQTYNPDVLLLQEADAATADRFRQAWEISSGETRYMAQIPGVRQATISRYPLRETGRSYHQGRVLKVQIDTPDGPVEVWNVHASQPVVWEQHNRQMASLAAAIARVDGPLIVGGDFNTTDQAEVYRLINRRLKNAHWEAGWGFGLSFPAHQPVVRGIWVPVPVVRIDHIFFSDHFFAHTAQTIPQSGGSDHLPVITRLSLIQPVPENSQ
jgi:vancomycin resistance protein VanJ